ncbi:HEAT repeat domain-containing protein [Halovenus rubra]|uniref:HEAT repeat domain-containing protein n=2 Tax=Halovenus rubra TaxID=869890 RepID=A0ABD5X5I9_9EURY|nr:HEAT repeat domain-containing protein [Halovenus rubra]
MSNGDSEDTEDADVVDPADPTVFQTQLDEAAEAVDAADTEAALDEADELLDEVESDLNDATFAVELEDEDEEDENEDEDKDNPRDGFEDRLSSLRDDIEEQRGPYLAEVTDALDSAESTITSSEWAKEGKPDVVTAVNSYVDTATVVLSGSYGGSGETPADAAETLATVREEIADSGFHPDTDESEIQELLDSAETLESELDDVLLFSDLEVREQLRREGFYDVLESENRKDFPPEWTAIKMYEKRGEVEPILSAFDKLGSDFMEENILDSLEHIAPEEAYDEVAGLAQRRNNQAVRILGRIGDERACGTLENFLGGGDVALEKITLRALGMIGSEDSTEPVAKRLGADNVEVRSSAARALGLIGDTRAIEPLADILGSDEADEVRASAAWALNQIGTERALMVAAKYTEDRSYIVQAQAEKATNV